MVDKITLDTLGDIAAARASSKPVTLGTIVGLARSVGIRRQITGDGQQTFEHLKGAFIATPHGGKPVECLDGQLFLPAGDHKQIAEAIAKSPLGVEFALELQVSGAKTLSRFLVVPTRHDPLSRVMAAVSKGKK